MTPAAPASRAGHSVGRSRRTRDEVKRRPLYVIVELQNFPDERPLTPRAIVADPRVREYVR